MSRSEMFADLAAEQRHLDTARRQRDRMIAAFERVDSSATADEISGEFVEMTVAEALDSLRSPGAGEFFGRIDTEPNRPGDDPDRYYIGRRHIDDEERNPVVVDWRAPIAAPFYRATPVDPLGVSFRRRFTLDDGELTAYLDEQLDADDAGSAATGIPDPVLAEIGAERSGEMREIVATIQGEQDLVIRAPIDQALVVQGGPGTGKTAVALHRAAYLLFEHRRRLARDGVLVVGPNRAFLDYVGNVLPSLGERAVRQCTVLDLCVPKVEISGRDNADEAGWKGQAERLDELEAAALARIVPPPEPVVVKSGTRKFTFEPAEIAEWIETAKSAALPINERRTRLRSIAQQALRRRAGGDDRWSDAAALKSAINKAWPAQKPIVLVDRFLPGPRGKKRQWTAADQLLVDEANSMLNGTPFTYGHVIVDEAQDHSAVALRCIGRRSPETSLTLVGDVAQSTTPAGQHRWADIFAHLRPAAPAVGDVAELTIGYRVPEPILEVANRLLPHTGVDARPSSSVRKAGSAPHWVACRSDEIARRTAEVVADSRYRLTGVVAPPELHASIAESLGLVGRQAVSHVHDLRDGDVPLFDAESVKGLEFDGVIVVNPHDILGESERGARLLYVAMSRAVQALTFVTDADVPPVLAE